MSLDKEASFKFCKSHGSGVERRTPETDQSTPDSPSFLVCAVRVLRFNNWALLVMGDTEWKTTSGVFWKKLSNARVSRQPTVDSTHGMQQTGLHRNTGCSLDVRHLNRWRRHLVNAYEVKAGMVFIAGKTVWSMPERFKVVCIPCKALYKCSAFIKTAISFPAAERYFYDLTRRCSKLV